MADTHPDGDALPSPIMEDLRKRMEQMTRAGTNRITAGSPGERPLYEEVEGAFLVRQMPDDPACLRISIGEPRGADGAYIVIRGRPWSCIALLERALAVLKASPLAGSAEKGEGR